MNQPEPFHIVPDLPPAPTSATIVPLSQIQPAPLQWLWPGRIPLGKLTLLLGEPAVGKSLLALDLAARVSNGRPWPDSPNARNEPAGVVILSAEDALDDTVRPRLDAAHADISRITAITSVTRNILSPLPLPLRATCLMPGLPHLDAAIEKTSNCRLVVIDPLIRSLAQTAHSSDADTRAVIEPLADLAARHHVAVVATYQAARTATGFAIQKMIAKLSPGAARTVWAILPDDDSPRRRLFLPVKNIVSEPSTPWAFSITPSDEHQAPALTWDTHPPESSASHALNRIAAHEDMIDARNWLREALSHGPLKASNVLAEAKFIGFSDRMIRRAFRQLHAIRARQDLGCAAAWFWALPDHKQKLEELTS